MKLLRYVQLASAVALTTAAVPSSAAIITFNNFNTGGPFGGNGQPFATYTEAGFTVSAPAGQYVQSTNGANSANNAITTGTNNGTASALLTIIGTGLFSFSSFDAYAVNSAAAYTVTGYLGAAQVFASSGSIGAPTTVGVYSTYGGPSGSAVDRITIATNAGFQLFLDNITTGTPVAAAVPEPATWAMMIAGFGMVGGAMRRRQRATVRFA